MTKIEEVIARQELKALVDQYATESDKNNQDYYREIFMPDCHVRVYFNNELGMDLTDVETLITTYKSFGAAKEAFHMNGHQVVEFQDDTHATGICYAMANLVTEEDGANILTSHAIRYYDTYVNVEGKWMIAGREQYFIFSEKKKLEK